MHVPSIRRFGALLVAAAVLAGCTGSAEPTGDGPSVIVTTAILGDLVAEVLSGTDAQVEVLMGSGVDPHSFAPSAKDALRLREADLIFANGLGLEAAMDDVLDAAEGDGVSVVRLGELLEELLVLDPDTVDADDDHPDDEAFDEHGSVDPHVWMDPAQVESMALSVSQAYARLFPDAADTVQQDGLAVAERYLDLRVELLDLIAAVPIDQRLIVTNHDALGYLARSLDMQVIGTVLPGTSTQAAASAADVAALSALLAETGVTTIFTDPETSDRVARTIADQVGGVEVVELYSGSLGPAGSGAETLHDLLRTDVERIVDALTRDS